MCGYHGALLLFFSSMFAFSPRVCVRVCVCVWVFSVDNRRAGNILSCLFILSRHASNVVFTASASRFKKKKQADTEGRRGGTENEEKE